MPGGGNTMYSAEPSGDSKPKVVSGPGGGGMTVVDDGKEGEGGVDVMEETKQAAAEEVMGALKSGNVADLKRALTEFVYSCK